MDEFFDRAVQTNLLPIDRVLAEARVFLPFNVELTQLSGGFQNRNFVAHDSAHTLFVLRVSNNPDILKKELTLLATLHSDNTAFPIPSVLWARTEAPTPVAAISFMHGEMLWKVRSRLSIDARRYISGQLGVILAQIHAHKYSSFGFLNADLKVNGAIGSFAEWMVGYMRSCIDSPRFRRRIDQDLRRRLAQCIDSHPDYHRAEAKPCLCHGDFNEKNILVDINSAVGPTISGVLDWEFSISATPSVDIGNLFRFSVIDPWINESSFETGYLSAGGELAPDWRSRACFVDLIALCHFLDSEEERPKTHETAIRLMDASLARLGS